MSIGLPPGIQLGQPSRIVPGSQNSPLHLNHHPLSSWHNSSVQHTASGSRISLSVSAVLLIPICKSAPFGLYVFACLWGHDTVGPEHVIKQRTSADMHPVRGTHSHLQISAGLMLARKAKSATSTDTRALLRITVDRYMSEFSPCSESDGWKRRFQLSLGEQRVKGVFTSERRLARSVLPAISDNVNSDHLGVPSLRDHYLHMRSGDLCQICGKRYLRPPPRCLHRHVNSVRCCQRFDV